MFPTFSGLEAFFLYWLNELTSLIHHTKRKPSLLWLVFRAIFPYWDRILSHLHFSPISIHWCRQQNVCIKIQKQVFSFSGGNNWVLTLEGILQYSQMGKFLTLGDHDFDWAGTLNMTLDDAKMTSQRIFLDSGHNGGSMCFATLVGWSMSLVSLTFDFMG